MSKLRKVTAAGNQRRMHKRRYRQPGTPKPSREELIEAAADEAQAHGKSLTAIRKHVLNVLLNTRRPMTAYEVLDSLNGVGSISPPTAYRALDFLIELGFIKRIESLNAYIALEQGPSELPVAMFICDQCGGAEELAVTDQIRMLLETAEARGFGARSVTLEVRGDCRGRLGCAPLSRSMLPDDEMASPPVDQYSHK